MVLPLRKRSAGRLATLFAFVVVASPISAQERLSANPESKIRKTISHDSPLVNDLNRNYLQVFQDLRLSKIERPPVPRVSRSRSPLRQITLIGGDQFAAECLDWGSNSAAFRLMNGQTIQLPCSAVAAMKNPPGEVDLIDETDDEHRPASVPEAEVPPVKYRHEFRPPCCARIEFQFHASISELAAFCGEWQFEWQANQVKQPPIVVRIDSDRRLSVSGFPSTNDATRQPLNVADGEHSFIALFTQDRLRLIHDDALLASCVVDHASVQSCEIQPPNAGSKNILRIDSLSVRRLDSPQSPSSSECLPRDTDRIELSSGDAIYGQLIGLNRTRATIQIFGKPTPLPWTEISGLSWRQPETRVSQFVPAKTGMVARIEMQPFADRPENETECWNVTIVGVDASRMSVQHPLAGDLSFRWSEIRKVTPLFFGQTLLIDSREFHLGNSIRSDLHRPLPDGTQLERDFQLSETPAGKLYLSFNLAEMEAASPDAPPGSPFLADLRAGHLVTELFMNEHKIGTINSLVRYKATRLHPDRIRMEIPRSAMNAGRNSIRLRQQPLKPGGQEYDDCELGDIRMEFEIR